MCLEFEEKNHNRLYARILINPLHVFSKTKSQIRVKTNQDYHKWKYPLFKQFVVTNCSKEQPSSIVTKTLKNRILVPIATSKELHFNADFKYTSFIKFSLTHQKLQAWENLHYFKK